MSKTTKSVAMSPRDLEILDNGRKSERLEIIEELEKIASASVRTNPEHALHLGFAIQAIKAMSDARNLHN